MTDDLEKRLLRVGERVPVPCPDGIKGCLVAHYRIETDPVCREAAPTIAQRKIARLDERIADLQAKLDGVRERGQELGFRPCVDCFDGFCTMNCSSAPIIMKVEP